MMAHVYALKPYLCETNWLWNTTYCFILLFIETFTESVLPLQYELEKKMTAVLIYSNT